MSQLAALANEGASHLQDAPEIMGSQQRQTVKPEGPGFFNRTCCSRRRPDFDFCPKCGRRSGHFLRDGRNSTAPRAELVGKDMDRCGAHARCIERRPAGWAKESEGWARGQDWQAQLGIVGRPLLAWVRRGLVFDSKAVAVKPRCISTGAIDEV